MKPEILEIVYKFHIQERESRMKVPKVVCECLNVSDTDKVHLDIKDEDGHCVFQGDLILTSGCEIVFRDRKPKPGKRVIVSISLPGR